MFEFKKIISIFTNNSFKNLIISIGIFFSIIIFKKIIIQYMLRVIKRIVSKTENKIDDDLEKAIYKPIIFFITFLAFYLSTYHLIKDSIHTELLIVWNKFLKLSLAIFFAWIIYNLTLENSLIYIGIKKN
ncbi:MAG: hypothetical protein ACRC7R_03415, partial [Sarcina sp.]